MAEKKNTKNKKTVLFSNSDEAKNELPPDQRDKKSLIKENVFTKAIKTILNKKSSNDDKANVIHEHSKNVTQENKPANEPVIEHKVIINEEIDEKTSNENNNMSSQDNRILEILATSLVESEIAIRNENEFGFNASLKPMFQLTRDSFFWFDRIDDIPSFFLQMAFKKNDIFDPSFRGQVLNTSEIYTIPVIAESIKTYDQDTSNVLVTLSPNGFKHDLSKLDYIDQELAIISVIKFADTNPQQQVTVMRLANNIAKLLQLHTSSRFLIFEQYYKIIGDDIGTTPLRSMLTGKEVMEKGQPHILFAAAQYTNNFTIQRLSELLLTNGQLKFDIGRDPNSLVKIGDTILTFEATFTTDQFVAKLSEINNRMLQDNKLTKDQYLESLRPFMTDTAIIHTENIDIYFDQRSVLHLYTQDDYKNYLLMYYLCRDLEIEVMGFLNSMLSSLSLYSATDPTRKLIDANTGKSDSVLMNDMLNNLRLTKTSNIETIIIMEGLRPLVYPHITQYPTLSGVNMIQAYIDCLIMNFFFPHLFENLTYRLGAIINYILLRIYPDIFNEFISSHGLYVKYDSESETWIRTDISSYTYDNYITGIYPSIYVIKPRSKRAKPLVDFHNLIQPYYYAIPLERKNSGMYPTLVRNQIYASPWPMADIDDQNTITYYASRFSLVKNHITTLMTVYLAKDSSQILLSTAPKANATITTLKTVIAKVLDLMDEALPVFARYVTPIMRQFKNSPLVPGDARDVICSIDTSYLKKRIISVIGVGGSKVDSEGRHTSTQFGMPTGNFVINLEGFFSTNIAIAITGPVPRGNIETPEASKVYRPNVRHISPMALWSKFHLYVATAKDLSEQLGIFLGVIAREQYGGIFTKFRADLPTKMSAQVAKNILAFFNSKMIEYSESGLAPIYTIFAGPGMDNLLIDPRKIDFQIIFLNRMGERLDVPKPDGNMYTSFNLLDQYARDRVEVEISLLTSEMLPKTVIMKGLVLGSFVDVSPKLTDYANLSDIHEYDETKTFIQDYIKNDDGSSSYYQTQYVYKYNDTTYKVRTPYEIEHTHTLAVNYPSDIFITGHRSFILQALNLGKIKLLIRNVHFVYKIYMISHPLGDNEVSRKEMNVVFDLSINSEVLPVITLFDSRNIYYGASNLLVHPTTRWLLPIHKPVDRIVASGLYDLNRQNKPYIKDNFFLPNDDDQRDLDAFPNNVNKLKVYTNHVSTDLPELKFSYGNSFI